MKLFFLFLVTLVASDYSYWCIKDNVHGCCCAADDIEHGAQCFLSTKPYIIAKILNITLETKRGNFNQRAIEYTFDKQRTIVVQLTQLVTDFYFGFWEVNVNGTMLQNAFFVTGGNTSACW